jgi:hypothetical protein
MKMHRYENVQIKMHRYGGAQISEVLVEAR